MILYRVYEGSFDFQYKMLMALTILELVGTTTETGIVMWLFGSLWDQWSISLKIVTPILHVLFSAAQLHGARIFYGMAKAEREKGRRQRRALADAVEREESTDEHNESKPKALPSFIRKIASRGDASERSHPEERTPV